MAFSTVATWKLTKWTGPELIRRVPKIVTLYGKVMDQQFKEEIKDEQFNWPNETKRYGKLLRTTNLKKRAKIKAEQGGKPYKTVFSPRDIVDSGDFLRSQNRETLSPTELRFSWTTPYANLIFNGYTLNSGYVAPPRNWIKPALEKQPLDAFFREQWARLATNNL